MKLKHHQNWKNWLPREKPFYTVYLYQNCTIKISKNRSWRHQSLLIAQNLIHSAIGTNHFYKYFYFLNNSKKYHKGPSLIQSKSHCWCWANVRGRKKAKISRGTTNVGKTIISDIFQTSKYPVIQIKSCQNWPSRPTDTGRIWKNPDILAL